MHYIQDCTEFTNCTQTNFSVFLQAGTNKNLGSNKMIPKINDLKITIKWWLIIMNDWLKIKVFYLNSTK